MKKVILLALIALITNSLLGCSSDNNAEISGVYEFEGAVYLSSLSSSSIENIEKHMEGTVYTINKDSFEIVSSEYLYKISDPSYERIEMDNDIVETFNDAVFDAVSISEYKEKYQYIIHTKENGQVKFYLYSMDDELWIASYMGNTANNTVLIMDIYKLK